MINKFTQRAQSSLNFSLKLARELGHSYIGTEHLLLGLLSEKESIAYKVLSGRGARLSRLKQSLTDYVGTGTKKDVSSADMSPRLARTIENASNEALRLGAKLIGSEHLLFSLINQKDAIGTRLLESEGIPASEIKADLTVYLGASTVYPSTYKTDEESKKTKLRALNTYGKDLTSYARLNFSDPLIGRDAELLRLVRILCRRQKNNPCLIGEPGVGKTALIEGLASLIASGKVPEELREKRIISLDLPSMLAGAKYRGEFEDRMKNIIEEVKRAGDVILFIDEIHVITGAGAAEGAIDAANILKPPLSRGEIRVIGATTVEEYRAKIEKDPALERRFQPITVSEPNENEAVEILLGLRSKYEIHHSVKISDEAIKAAVKLSVLYLPDRFLPDKAIDLIDEAAAKLHLCASEISSPSAAEILSQEKEQAVLQGRFDDASKIAGKERSLISHTATAIFEEEENEYNSAPTLKAEDVAALISEQTGIPCTISKEAENDGLIYLEERLSKSIIGQNEAIKKIADTVRRARTGIRQQNRPCGSFLFLGNTGVGKTELCRALCSALFNSPSAFIRLDMSEYMEKHSVSKIIGAPPGYVGYGEGNILCEKVRRNPYSLILLDEIEKAHPDVLNILLQILDDGTLNDSAGKKIDFKNTIVIMTSNLTNGREKVSQRIMGFCDTEKSANDPRELEVLKSFFHPELLNRIDEIIIFKDLSEKDLCRITEKMLQDLSERVYENGIKLEISEEIAPIIAKYAFKQKLGARPIRREIIGKIEAPLAEFILRAKDIFKPIKIFADGDDIKIE